MEDESDIRRYGRLGLGREMLGGGGPYDDHAWIWVVHTDVAERDLAGLEEEQVEIVIESIVAHLSEIISRMLQELWFSGNVKQDIESLPDTDEPPKPDV